MGEVLHDGQEEGDRVLGRRHHGRERRVAHDHTRRVGGVGRRDAAGLRVEGEKLEQDRRSGTPLSCHDDRRGDLLVEDNAILVQGRLQKDEQSIKVIADAIIPMNKAEETSRAYSA